MNKYTIICLVSIFAAVYSFPNQEDYDYGGSNYDESKNDVRPDPDENNVSEAWPPHFVHEDTTITLEEGDKFKMSCATKKKGTGHVVILKKLDDLSNETSVNLLFAGNVSLDPKSKVLATLEDSYEIEKVTRGDAGFYVCKIQEGKKSVDLIYTLIVQYAPEANALHPVRHVTMGDSVSLKCNVDGIPKPNVTWTKEGGKFASGAEQERGFSIMLDDVDRHVEGTYKCTADNGIGQPASSSVVVSVDYAPEIFTEKAIIRTGSGDKVELVCVVHSRPTAEVEWSRDGSPLVLEPRVKETDSGHRHAVIIEEISEENYGSYECLARNSLGESSATINVNDSPQAAKFTSPPAGAEDNSYVLVWEIESFYPIEEYSVKYKSAMAMEGKNESDQWMEIKKGVSNADFKSDGIITKMSQPLQDLEPATDYEVIVSVKNSRKWGEEAKFSFSTKKEMTDYKTSGAARTALLSFGVSVIAILTVFLS